MKNHLSTISHQHGSTGGDWKHQFRLNALDLNPLLQGQGEQLAWVEQEPYLQRMLDSVQQEVLDLNALIVAAGEQPLASDNTSLLTMLGLVAQDKPSSVCEKLQFAWRMLCALVMFHHRAAVVRSGLRNIPVPMST